MKKKLFISHKQAKHICDKKQYGEATFLESVSLSIRISWCRLTKIYSKKNNKLTHTVQSAEMNCLNQFEREGIQQKFEQELNKRP
tara:strand:- start:813 stop:1067 length:255 start_codon:yes stop_codon:yes gene_type:complete